MFWCPFGSRFGFVALLSIIISIQTFSSFSGSLTNSQWQKLSKIMFTFIFVLVQFFSVQEPTCHLYHGWAKSYSPGTVATGVKLTSQLHLLSGTRTNVVHFQRLLLARVRLPRLHKEICRQWDSNQRSLFLKATASTR